ncbi:thiol:disulfide interchange protein DsbD [Pontibacter mucosus]|uniref:Thiol:disulfide interchange protein DsbD n=1 Tax=Pontibacter mucosus TaxID=1649266 RepID=A0A2T5YEF1_9BACT|nr:thioredoxin family protein [Pontibacter mucosus]PTX15055.1 thiol:disulfide interchange protein DsbD [Pontibacter mucosus]
MRSWMATPRFPLLRRLIALTLLCCLSLVTASAQSPVRWQISARLEADNTYTLTLQGSLQPGWHVYAAADPELGLDGLRLEADDPFLTLEDPVPLLTPTRQQEAHFDNKWVPVYRDTIALEQRLCVQGPVPASLTLTLTGFAASREAFLPLREELRVSLPGGEELSANLSGSLKLASLDLARAAACGTEAAHDGSLPTVFLLGFLGGLLALLTPCVFPMVPLTVTYFSKGAGSRRQALRHGGLFGLGILGIYLACSLPFHLLDSVNPGLLNSLSTNVWVNLLFFAVFVGFALSFFGVFELTLPGRLTNRADAQAGLGSVGGIFFLALTLVLVSFSCTGPILGTLLVGSLTAAGGAWQLTAGMGGFGLALALPFALLAFFPHWLQHLPRSGGWLRTMKRALAFVELALALKFLSNADLVAQWGLLKREVFIGLWLLLAVGLGLYLLGILRFPDEPRGQAIGRGRQVAGLLTLIFGLYLASGLANSPQGSLRLVSGFPPPWGYSLYSRAESQINAENPVQPKVVNDLETAMRLAREEQKPLLLDFTGHACVNCRKMEEQVWTAPAVSRLLREEVILVSLYVDDRQSLPLIERFTYTDLGGTLREVRTVGEKWSAFQALNFGQVTQPLYVLLSPDRQLLNQPIGYTPDERVYEAWLRCGLNTPSTTKREAP